MTKKFDLYEALLNKGFERESQVGATERLVRNDFIREIEVLWYGVQKTTLTVEVVFNPEHTVCQAYYYQDGFKRPFKTKVHMNDKRAYNAINATVNNNGFEF